MQRNLNKKEPDNLTTSICAIEIYNETIWDLLVHVATKGKDGKGRLCTVCSEPRGVAKGGSTHTATGVALTRRVIIRHQDRTVLQEEQVDKLCSAMKQVSKAQKYRTTDTTRCVLICEDNISGDVTV